MCIKLPSAIVVFALAISCQNTYVNKDSSVDSEFNAAKKGIEESNKEWIAAVKNRDSVSLANLYTKDAKIISCGGAIVEGREQILKDMGESVRYGMVGFTDTTLGFWGGNHIYTGEYVETFYDSSGTPVSHGKSLCVWKEEDGKWKLYRDMYVPEKRHQ